MEGTVPEPLVLHVVPSPDARGGQREARALADWLDAPGVRRHRVLSLVGGPGGGEGQVAVDYVLDGGGAGGPATTVGFDPRVVLRLRRTLARLDPVLVVAHGGEPLKFLVAAGSRRRPLAYYAIGTLAPQGQRPLRRTMWRYLARRADVVVAEGVEVLEECRTVLGVAEARLVFVPNGRDPDEFRPDPGAAPQSEPMVTFVGALNAQKRPDRFVEVIAALRVRGLGLRAQVVGDGPMRASLEPSAAAAGVELLGARGDVAEVLRGTDVMLFPSLPRGEGMPGVLIEAGLSAVAVVATAAPGVSTIVADGETGMIVAVDDVDAMVDAVAGLIADPVRRQRMGHEARRRCVEQFSMETVANGWRAALMPLLAGR